MKIRLLTEEEIPLAERVAGTVHLKCIAPFYDNLEMRKAFYDYINVESLQKMVKNRQLVLWGVFQGLQVCAVSAMQKEGLITMLYVLPQFQKRGVGKALIRSMMEYAYNTYHHKKITINAMPPWTVEYFKKQGFRPIDNGQEQKPPFTPMEAKYNPEVVYEEKPFPADAALKLGILLVVLCILISCGYMILNGI